MEAVTCGETEVSVRNLPMHIQQLSQMEVGTTVTGMELEFKVRTLFDFVTLTEMRTFWEDSDDREGTWTIQIGLFVCVYFFSFLLLRFLEVQ